MINFYIQTALHFPPVTNVFRNYISRYRRFLKLYCRRTTTSKGTKTIKKLPRDHVFRVLGGKFKNKTGTTKERLRTHENPTRLLPQKKFHFFTLSRYQGTYRMDEERSMSNRAYYGSLCSSQTLAFSHCRQS